jgi:hypothetical protein
MSGWQEPIPPHEPKPQKSGLAFLAVIFGAILLLPGACALFFIFNGIVTFFGVLGLAIGAVGVWLIIWAAKKP